jgi:rod shape determining protein RodA
MNKTLRLDWPLLIGILMLSLLGLIVLYSAKQDFDVIQRQLLRLMLASVIMLAIAQCSPRFFYKLAPWLYCSGLILLISVLISGHISKGAQRWLDIWIFRFQPAELMKLAVPMMIARYFSQHPLPPTWLHSIIPGILIVLPTALIAKQPDLGTALLVGSTGALVLFFSGISWRFLLTLLGSCLASLPVVWHFMHDYQQQRILTLLDPNRDPLGTGYHIIQSTIAIGSGGIYGKGWLNGTQSHLEYLPERTTDFIFAVFGEEFGFIGGLLLLTIYLFVILRGLYIGVQAQDTFARLLAGSLTMTLFVYVFVNIGMVSGILPVVGIPLPLISYGGTSLVTLMISFGMLISIRTHRTLI